MIGIRTRIRRREKFLARENGICPREKTQRDRFLRKPSTPGCQPDSRRGHQNPRSRDRADHHQRIKLLRAPERRSRVRHEHVDRHAFRMGIEMRKLFEQAHAVFVGFAHSQNSAAADRDAGLAHMGDRSQAVFVNPCRDDFSVELGRGIEIVVIRAQACFLKPLSLRFRQHTQRAAYFHVQRRHAAHHFEHAVEFLSIGNLPPRGSHAKSRRAFRFRALRCVQHIGGIH